MILLSALYPTLSSVIKSAIRNKKNVVTTSYVSPAMLELEEDAKNAGITVMNEIAQIPALTIYMLSRLLRRFIIQAEKSVHFCHTVVDC
jgi:saccharopine dehydrogenase-like NADP-dependent oxidoreductase